MGESFRDLVAWQKAMQLVTSVYKATETFPNREMYGLTNQVRRSAVSIPSNIAEGKGRLTDGEYVQFLSHARGSLCEMQTQLEIARNLGFIDADNADQLETRAREVGRMINGLIKAIRVSPAARRLQPEG